MPKPSLPVFSPVEQAPTPNGRFFGASALVCEQADTASGGGTGQQEQVIEIETEQELWSWVRRHLGVEIPTEKVCPEHVAPFTAFAHAYFARDPISVWLASRAFGGKSVLLALLSLAEACTLGAGISLLGGSGEQSRRVHAYMDGTDSNLPDGFWNAPAAPRYLLKNSPAAWRTSLNNGGWVTALTASQRSVRGPHPQRLRLDECFVADTPVQTPCGPSAIQGMRSGDVVRTYDNGVLRETVVRCAAPTGRKPIVCVRLNDGTQLYVTRNHPFWTPDGWQNAGSLEGSAVARLAGKPRIQGDRGQTRPYASLVSVDSVRQAGWAEVYNLSVAGPHTYLADGVLVHNCDEMDVPIFDAAMGQPMSRGPILSQVVASSTHQHPDGTMTEILRRARAHGWPTHAWCYKETSAGEHGWLTQAEIERKRATITAVMWETEFELQEPSPEGRAFDKDSIETMFDPGLGECEGTPGEVLIWERPTWELDPDWPDYPAWVPERYGGNLEDMSRLRGSRRWRKQNLSQAELNEWDEYRGKVKKVTKRIRSRYAAGADWGKKRDHTIIWIMRIDCRPMRMVAFANLVRQPYPKMFAQFNDLVARYRAQSAHDATGIGNAAEDYMEFSVLDIQMVGAARRELFNEYIVAVEGQEFVAPRVKYAYDEHRYAVQADLWGTGHPPDSVVAGAMTYHAATYGGSLVR